MGPLNFSLLVSPLNRTYVIWREQEEVYENISAYAGIQ